VVFSDVQSKTGKNVKVVFKKAERKNVLQLKMKSF